MNDIEFPRKPYFITYKDFRTGEVIRARRVPPPKMHDIMAQDTVSLKYSKNESWKEGQKVRVKIIKDRSPNVLQLENKDGETTFEPYYNIVLEEKSLRGVHRLDDMERNQYLLWP